MFLKMKSTSLNYEKATKILYEHLQVNSSPHISVADCGTHSFQNGLPSGKIVYRLDSMGFQGLGLRMLGLQVWPRLCHCVLFTNLAPGSAIMYVQASNCWKMSESVCHSRMPLDRGSQTERAGIGPLARTLRTSKDWKLLQGTELKFWNVTRTVAVWKSRYYSLWIIVRFSG